MLADIDMSTDSWARNLDSLVRMCNAKLIEAHNIWSRIANGQKLGNMGNMPAKGRRGLKFFFMTYP